MKKLIAVVLILVVLIPACAFAIDESDVVGCWAHYDVLETGEPCMSMMYLSEDNTCYYLIQLFHVDEAGLGRTYVGNWELIDDDSLYAKIGNNSDVNLRFTSDGIAIDVETYDVYVNITPFTLY